MFTTLISAIAISHHDELAYNACWNCGLQAYVL